LLSEPGAAIAQSFEVASIKVSNAPDGHSHWNSDPGTLTMSNTRLRNIIEEAFDVRSFSLSGPELLNSARFDIRATMKPGTTREERRLML
jgi:uncharacterized protein (TIGR03435 family)